MSAPTALRAPSLSWQEAIRTAGPADREKLRRFLARLSPASTYTRFHGDGFHPTDTMLDLLLCRELEGRALVVQYGHEIIGHAVWTRLPRQPDAAELGVVVADEWNGQGIGSQLGAAAIRDAARHGIQQLVLPVLVEDRVSRRLVHELLPDASGTHDGDVIEFWARIAGRPLIADRVHSLSSAPR